MPPTISTAEILMANIADLMSAAAVKAGLSPDCEADLDAAGALALTHVVTVLIDVAAPLLDSAAVADLREAIAALHDILRSFAPVAEEPGASDHYMAG